MSNVGTMFGLLILEHPWPPASGVLLRQNVVGETLIRIHASPEGRLIFVVNAPDGSPALMATSPPIAISGVSDVRLRLSWDLDKRSVEFTLLNSITFRNGVTYDAVFEMPPRPEQGPPAVMDVWDVAADQETRRVKVAAVAPKLPLFHHAEGELDLELRQLHSLIGLVNENRAHVRGIANIVRKLITGDVSKKNQTPLMMLVAGKLDRPLVVYGDAGTIPATENLSTDFQGPSPFLLQPTHQHRFRMDIDRWLERNGAIIDGVTMTNHEVIKAIADKIGAHVDLTVRKTVDRLSSGLNGGAIRATDLDAYVVRLGMAVCDLGVGLLRGL